ncbi:MAG: hypothetical protein JKX76_02670 [Colwellia sp.]|nr:hypothetical protein [Colwellia sp.]
MSIIQISNIIKSNIIINDNKNESMIFSRGHVGEVRYLYPDATIAPLVVSFDENINFRIFSKFNIGNHIDGENKFVNSLEQHTVGITDEYRDRINEFGPQALLKLDYSDDCNILINELFQSLDHAANKDTDIINTARKAECDKLMILKTNTYNNMNWFQRKLYERPNIRCSQYTTYCSNKLTKLAVSTLYQPNIYSINIPPESYLEKSWKNGSEENELSLMDLYDTNVSCSIRPAFKIQYERHDCNYSFKFKLEEGVITFNETTQRTRLLSQTPL